MVEWETGDQFCASREFEIFLTFDGEKENQHAILNWIVIVNSFEPSPSWPSSFHSTKQLLDRTTVHPLSFPLNSLPSYSHLRSTKHSLTICSWVWVRVRVLLYNLQSSLDQISLFLASVKISFISWLHTLIPKFKSSDLIFNFKKSQTQTLQFTRSEDWLR